MADGKFTLYIRKVVMNPMLGRKQMVRCQYSSLDRFLTGSLPLSRLSN